MKKPIEIDDGMGGTYRPGVILYIPRRGTFAERLKLDAEADARRARECLEREQRRLVKTWKKGEAG